MATQNLQRRWMVVLGATAVGVAVMMGGGPAAAAPQGFGDIDGAREGSLTVHKYLHQIIPQRGDVSAAPPAGQFTDPVQGVVFTLYPLLQDGAPLDLSVAENWNALETLVPGAGCTAPSGLALGTPAPMPPTDAAGSSHSALALGAYQVCETSAPTGIIDAAEPFIVTVPLPHEQGWVYDVHAYPKNSRASLEKSIEKQTNLGLGSVVEFPVRAPIPTRGDAWTGLTIRDTLDSRLAPVSPADIAVNVDDERIDPTHVDVQVQGQQVSVTFTASGLRWLNERSNAQAGKILEVVFAGTVTAVGDGSIANTAELWANNPDLDARHAAPLMSNTVQTHWGSLQVQKRAAGTTGATGRLKGATFEVYAAVDPHATDCSRAVAEGAPLSVSGAREFVSSSAGVISIPGLFVSDSVHPTIDALQRCYVLKEVRAPAGYVTPAQPFTGVAVRAGKTAISENPAIENTQQKVPELPLTGSAGQLMLVGGGIAALAAALWLAAVNRRRRSGDS